MRIGELFRQLLGIVKWTVVGLAVGLPIALVAVTAIMGMDFVERGWRSITSLPSQIFGSTPKHDLKTPAKVQQPALAIRALAAMMAYDAHCEHSKLRPQVMKEMGLAALRLKAIRPDSSLTGIVENNDTWLPDNWDPYKMSRGKYYPRELDRMESRVTKGELVDARLIAEQIINLDPGAGPTRYSRPEPCTLRRQGLAFWANEDGAAKEIEAKMELDPGLARLGSKTRFYRQKSAK